MGARLYRGASQPWAAAAAAPSGLVQATGRSGDAVAFLFGYPLRAGHPTDRRNKILWVVRLTRDGSPLDISARPVGHDGPVVHQQEPADSGPGEIYPSIVDVPAPGC